MTKHLGSKKFFISYLREDLQIAKKIDEQIRKNGHETFLDIRSINPGDEWACVIDREIKECDFFLLLWSPQGNTRVESFVPIELNLARLRHQKRIGAANRFIFPILIGAETKLPPEFNIDKLEAVTLEGDDLDGEIEIKVKKILLTAMKGHDHTFTITSPNDSSRPEIMDKIQDTYTTVIANARISDLIPPDDFDDFEYDKEILSRVGYIQECTRQTIKKNSHAVKNAIESFKEWMMNETVVRVIGAGRAKLAATMPANRLAHGGARVYEQDGLIPMPHDIKGGGIIAASASGTTPSVLGVLREIERKKKLGNSKRYPFKVVGIARNDAREFKGLCDDFIGIHLAEKPNSLVALADIEESVISIILDALIVSAGWRAGFDDTRWRLGHENLGATGPYDATAVPTQPLHSSHNLGDKGIG